MGHLLGFGGSLLRFLPLSPSTEAGIVERAIPSVNRPQPAPGGGACQRLIRPTLSDLSDICPLDKILEITKMIS